MSRSKRSFLVPLRVAGLESPPLKGAAANGCGGCPGRKHPERLSKTEVERVWRLLQKIKNRQLLQGIILVVRVIAGTFKSRLLKTLRGDATRPTSDRLKETLFNLLQNQLKGRHFLDCFAGSGSIGIEALSRGASSVAFIESSRRASRVIRENLERLGLMPSENYVLLNQAVENGLKILQQAGSKFDIVFLDPPYAAAEHYPEVLEKLQQYKILNDEAIVIAEHSKRLTLVVEIAGLIRVRELKQGDSVLSVYRESKLSPQE